MRTPAALVMARQHTGAATATELSLLPPLSPSLRLPGPWSALDKPAQHLPKEERTSSARRWVWRWAQSAGLLTQPVSCDQLPREVAGGALLRLAVVGLSCDWPDLAPGPAPAHRSPDDPPERLTQLWRALCLRLYRRPTVPVGPVLTTWNWRLAQPSGRTALPYHPADLLVPGAVVPLYCWPSAAAAPRLARLLATQTGMLAAVATLPRSAAHLDESGWSADQLVPVLEEVENASETIRLLLRDARQALAGTGPLTPVQRRVLDRVIAVPTGPRATALRPGAPGCRLPLALEAPWLLLGGGPVRRQAPPWSPHSGDADREQAWLLALLHAVGQELAAQCRQRPGPRTAHARAMDAWLAAAREYAHWLASCTVA